MTTERPGLVNAAVLASTVVLLAVLASACSQVPPAPARPDRAGEHAGFSPGGFLRSDDPARLAADLDAVVASGARWIRIDIDWSYLEPRPGRYNTAALDRVVEGAARRHLHVLGLLTYTPAWARPPGTDDHHPPTDPGVMARFATFAGGRWGRHVDAWEVWNEPNLAMFWSSGADPVAYGRLLRAVVPALRRSDPGTPILTGGLSAARSGDGDEDPLGFLGALYDDGAARLADGVAVHPYTYAESSPDLSTADQEHSLRMPAVRDLMVQRGVGQSKVWITEFGAPTGDSDTAVGPDRQAAIVREGLEEARTTAWVALALIYSLRDAGTDPSNDQQNFGVLAADGTPKPAMQAALDEFGLPWTH